MRFSISSLFSTSAFLLLFSLFGWGQSEITGRITDKSNGEPIPYVNIGLVNGRSGTVTDINGNFRLKLPEKTDSVKIRFSVYSFEKQTYDLDVYTKQFGATDAKIELQPIYLEQDEVLVKAPELKDKVLGHQVHSSSARIMFDSDEFGSELTCFIKVKRTSYVKDFNVYLINNDYDSLKLRLNFYACNSRRSPKDSLLTKSIVFDAPSDYKGDFRVALEDEHIILRENTFASLELVGGVQRKKPGKENVMFGAKLGTGSYARFASQSRWMTIPMVVPGFHLNVRQVVKEY